MSQHNSVLHPAIDEMVPAELDFAGDRKQVQVLTDKYKWIVQPTGNVTFSPSSAPIMQFNLSSMTEDLLFGQDVSLSFFFQTTATGGSYAYLQDGGLSWAKKIELKSGTQTIDSIDNAHLVINMLVYLSATKRWLINQGWSAGYYMDYIKDTVSQLISSSATTANLSDATGGNIDDTHQIVLGTIATPPVPNLTITKAGPPVVKAYAPLTTDVGAYKTDIYSEIKYRSKVGTYFNCPLSVISLFRTRRLVPLKYFGQLMLQISLEEPQKCLISDTAQASYTISNVRLESTMCVPHQSYAMALNQLMTASEVGFAMELDGFRLNVATPILASQLSVITNFQLSKCKALYALLRKQSDIANIAVPSLSKYENFNLVQYQWMLGTEYLPKSGPVGNIYGQTVGTVYDGYNNVPAKVATYEDQRLALYSGAGEFLAETEKAFNQFNDQNTGGLINLNNFLADEVIYDSDNNVLLSFPKRCVLGLDLEILPYTNTGFNTSQRANVTLNMIFQTPNSAAAANVAPPTPTGSGVVSFKTADFGSIPIEVDFIAHYDQIVSVKQGNLFVSL